MIKKVKLVKKIINVVPDPAFAMLPAPVKIRESISPSVTRSLAFTSLLLPYVSDRVSRGYRLIFLVIKQK